MTEPTPDPTPTPEPRQRRPFEQRVDDSAATSAPRASASGARRRPPASGSSSDPTVQRAADTAARVWGLVVLAVGAVVPRRRHDRHGHAARAVGRRLAARPDPGRAGLIVVRGMGRRGLTAATVPDAGDARATDSTSPTGGDASRTCTSRSGPRPRPTPRARWEHWREAREELFRTHSQSPVPAAERAGVSCAATGRTTRGSASRSVVTNRQPRRPAPARGGAAVRRPDARAADQHRRRRGVHAASAGSRCRFAAGSATPRACTGWPATPAACSCPSGTRRTGTRRTAPAATCSTPRRAPTSGPARRRAR